MGKLIKCWRKISLTWKTLLQSQSKVVIVMLSDFPAVALDTILLLMTFCER